MKDRSVKIEVRKGVVTRRYERKLTKNDQIDLQILREFKL